MWLEKEYDDETGAFAWVAYRGEFGALHERAPVTASLVS